MFRPIFKRALFDFSVSTLIFQRDIWPGVVIRLLYEDIRTLDTHESAQAGEILVAGLDLRDRSLRYYRYTDSKGRSDFYDAEGKAARKNFLRTPVDATRISSRFGIRKHPILGYSRLHKGVDFAAPQGTKVLAAGDGIVDFAGWKSGYGYYVRLRHSSNYKTAYAHLHSIATARGRRVKQGQIIGRVGSTGLSTGPHLHYEIMLGGRHINPLTVRSLPVRPLPSTEHPLFMRQLRLMEANIARLRSVQGALAKNPKNKIQTKKNP